jgi:hypothetical protein
MASDPIVASCAQQMASGALPRMRSPLLLGGRGTGRACSMCQSRIEAGDTELTLRWMQGGEFVEAALHKYCYLVWFTAADFSR